MADQHVGFQLDWDPTGIHQRWEHGPDERYLFQRLAVETAAITLRGGARRVLDVAAAEAAHTAEIVARGVAAVALDPSPAMLVAARQSMAERHVTFPLVRGLAETLPFADAAFDRVLCHSAIDHVADPDLAVREMARVLTADGRLVLSAVNYGGLSARASRLAYRLGRRSGVLVGELEDHQAWDSPVPVEHTFEVSFDRLRRLCAPYLELDDATGVSLGWGLPGWSRLLARLPTGASFAALRGLDALVTRRPALADFFYASFRPRPRATWSLPRPPEAGGFVVQPDDLPYPYRAQREIYFWNQSAFQGTMFAPGPAGQAWTNEVYTGDPTRTWVQDLIGRGPFRDAAMLGCDEEPYAAAWLDAGGSATLDVYDLSPHALRQVRLGLGTNAGRARFLTTDLNFATLPAARYDVVWSSACLHHIINLEHLLDEVERALRPGGLFAVHDLVGERRLQYSAARLARARAMLEEIPARFRRAGPEALAAPRADDLSPFCGMRPGDLLPLASARFEALHVARFNYLLPLPLLLDLEALAAEEPALFARVRAAEADAARDPELLPGSAYAVFRRR